MEKTGRVTRATDRTWPGQCLRPVREHAQGADADAAIFAGQLSPPIRLIGRPLTRPRLREKNGIALLFAGRNWCVATNVAKLEI